MDGATSPRLREVIAALVRHLHAFARDVRLTEEEFEIGIDFLNRIGHATNDVNNEGMLFSDVLGFSTLICLLNNGRNGATETASALLGLILANEFAPYLQRRIDRPLPDAGSCSVCRVLDPRPKGPTDGWRGGRRLASFARRALRESEDPNQADMNLRGKFTTDVEGKLTFRSVKPAGYPVPTDGPVGELLRAQKRHPYRPAHLHFLAYKPGYKTLITQVFVDNDERLQSDVVFGVTQHLIGNYQRHDEPRADHLADPPWYSLHYTFVMEPGAAKLPQPPIK